MAGKTGAQLELVQRWTNPARVSQFRCGGRALYLVTRRDGGTTLYVRHRRRHGRSMGLKALEAKP